MPDYSNGVIYTIKTTNGLYVGATCNYDDRKWNHSNTIHNKNILAHNYKLYKNIRENDGVWEMKKIKDFPCENNIELRQEEDRIMLEMGANLNEIRAYESYDESLERKKKYREANKERLKKYDIKYKKEWYKKNTEYAKEKSKEYREANKEQISARRREKNKCECGCLINRRCLAVHRKSKKHLDLILK